MTIRRVIAVALLIVAPWAWAADTGWIFGGSAATDAGAGVDWSDAANAAGSSTSTFAYADMGTMESTDVLRVQGYDLSSIPNGATINGIEVAVYMQGGDDFTVDARLIIAGTPAGATKNINMPTAASEVTTGGASDLWLLSPSVADLKDSATGIRIEATSDFDSGQARIYYVGIKVYYTPAAGDWWDTDWSHRIEGTIDAAYVDEEIPVVPVWIPASATAWFSAVDAAGDDIRVFNSDDTVELDYYIVDIDTAAPHCMLLVNVAPIIDTVTDAPFRVYAGNALASAASSGSAVFSGTGTIAMWALTETGGTNAVDITGNGYTATSNGSMTGANNVTAYRSDMPALDLDGSNDYLSLASTLFDALRTAGAYTIGMWADVDSTAADQRLFYSGNSPYHEFFLWMDAGGTGPSWAAAHRNTSDFQLHLNENGNDASANTWTWPIATWTGSTLAIYKNGSLRASGSVSTMADENGNAYIGRFPTRYADAQIAMPFVDSVARSSNYLATMYDAWATADFITWGSVEEAPTGGAANTTNFFFLF